MASTSFKERVKHDRAMRAKHVQTMQELFGISPEEEEEMHRKWGAARGMPSTWTPPSELDKKTHKPPVCQSKIFSVGDAAWCKGHAAAVCAAHGSGDKRTDDVAYIAAGVEVRLVKNEAFLRSRFRSDNNVEAEWLKAASDRMAEDDKRLSPHGGEDVGCAEGFTKGALHQGETLAGPEGGSRMDLASHGGEESPSG